MNSSYKKELLRYGLDIQGRNLTELIRDYYRVAYEHKFEIKEVNIISLFPLEIDVWIPHDGMISITE